MDISFCKVCSHYLTISKALNNQVIKIDNSDAFINIDFDKFNIYELNFEKNDLEKYLSENKIDKEMRIFYLKKYDLFKELILLNVNYLLKCSMCNAEYFLEPDTTIYSMNLKKQQMIFNDDNIDLKINDYTLPRTKDYRCPNNDCPTNKQNFDLKKKEAIFYRASNKYYLKYACVICKHTWNI